jgi:hypothetical protein
MYAKTRPSFLALLFVCCLLVSSLPARAQESNVQAATVVSALGDVLNTNDPNAPAAGEIAAQELAADQEFQAKVAFVNSLTEEQRTNFAHILVQHQAELEATIKELQTSRANGSANKVFLPIALSATGQANAATQSSTLAAHQAVQADAQIAQSLARAEGIQNTINQELAALLTPEQKALFEKTGFAQAPQMVNASAIQQVDETQSSSNCYYGAYYGSKASYWAWYAEYYAYLDYTRVNNTYSYRDWYYNYYGKRYAYSGTLYAGGAYALSLTQDPGDWDNTSYSEFGKARDNTYWGRYYAYYAWQAGSGYAYYAYVDADYAYYYEGLARTNIYSCSQ